VQYRFGYLLALMLGDEPGQKGRGFGFSH
jgi:hypothetical protein